MLFKKDIEHKLLFRLSLLAFCVAMVVIVLGAFTRLSDAGLGCPDWPGCYGHLLWPNESHEIAKAEAAFPHAPVEADKTWPEMVHRYAAGTLGLLILTIVIFAIREAVSGQQRLQKAPLKLPLILLALVILQAAFGMWTVTLKLWPKVVTAHLLGGFCTLSLLWLLVQRLGGEQWYFREEPLRRVKKLKPLLIFALVVVIGQIFLGGWVSSNYAALACPDLPKCLGQWLPPADFKTGFNVWQDIGPNYLGGQLDNHARTAIHLAHRMGAVLVVLTLLILFIQMWRTQVGDVHDWALAMGGVVLLQITLGLNNIILALPLSIAVGHNAIGAVLLLVLITIIYRIYKAQLIPPIRVHVPYE